MARFQSVATRFVRLDRTTENGHSLRPLHRFATCQSAFVRRALRDRRWYTPLPLLTIATNVPEHIGRYLTDIADVARPRFLPIRPSIALPKNTQFYNAHFKLDLLEQVGQNLSKGTLLMLLDTDMFAHRPLDADLLQRCARAGVGAFDISDQECSAYGNARVICDLETVAGRPLLNPRWFRAELLPASAAFIEELAPRARECFHRYVENLP